MSDRLRSWLRRWLGVEALEVEHRKWAAEVMRFETRTAGLLRRAVGSAEEPLRWRDATDVERAAVVDDALGDRP